LGLGQRRADQLVLEQRRRHVLEHRLAVAAGPVEFATGFHVTHDDFSLFYRYGNPAPASGLPRITRYSEPFIKRLFSRSAATEGRYKVSKNLTSGSRQYPDPEAIRDDRTNKHTIARSSLGPCHSPQLHPVRQPRRRPVLQLGPQRQTPRPQ